MSDLPPYLPKLISLKDKKCRKCDSQNLFKWFRPPQEDIKPICVNCTNIKLLSSSKEILRIDNELSVLEYQFRGNLRRYKQSQLLKYILQTQEYIGKEAKEKTSFRINMILKIRNFIEEVFKHSDPDGVILDSSRFLEFWDNFVLIDGLRFLRSNLYHQIVFLDSDRNEYYKYNYLRRMDGMGEFGVGRSSQIQRYLEVFGDLYDKELEKAINSSDKRTIIQVAEDKEIDEVEFISALYCGIQNYREHIVELNLPWVSQLDIKIKKLQKWRENEFYSVNTRLNVGDTKKSLSRVFGTEIGDIIYRNLISSSSRPMILPYGIEIEGVVCISPEWAYILELLFFAEANGEEIFQKVQEKKSDDFEKHIVREIFRRRGLKTHPGHEEKKNGNVIFEIDIYALDTQGTLWIVETKSQKLYKRFMESYLSWEKKCRNFIDKPDKNMSYSDIVKIISKKTPDYQQKHILPDDWEINDVRGLIVSQLPPFEEKYKGIYLIWYRELDNFFSLYYEGKL